MISPRLSKSRAAAPLYTKFSFDYEHWEQKTRRGLKYGFPDVEGKCSIFIDIDWEMWISVYPQSPRFYEWESEVTVLYGCRSLASAIAFSFKARVRRGLRAPLAGESQFPTWLQRGFWLVTGIYVCQSSPRSKFGTGPDPANPQGVIYTGEVNKQLPAANTTSSALALVCVSRWSALFVHTLI